MGKYKFCFIDKAGDDRLAPDTEDIASPEVALGTNIKFFGREYEAIYVRN